MREFHHSLYNVFIWSMIKWCCHDQKSVYIRVMMDRKVFRAIRDANQSYIIDRLQNVVFYHIKHLKHFYAFILLITKSLVLFSVLLVCVLHLENIYLYILTFLSSTMQPCYFLMWLVHAFWYHSLYQSYDV